MITEIEEIPVENEETDEPKTARGVEFTAGTISELPELLAWKDEYGLWYYIKNGEDICVYADTNSMIAKIDGGTELILDYIDMPYESLVDESGKKWKVNRYTTPQGYGLFSYRNGQDEWNNNVIKNLTSLTLQNWTNRNVIDMSRMFYNYYWLTTLTLGENFNTSNVTDMSYMFYNCLGLTDLNLSNLNTSAATNMSRMFAECARLTTLTLGGKFNTSNVTDMSDMFSICEALTTLDLSNFNTSNVTDMSGMFGGCSKLTSLDLSNFNTSNVKEMASMFDGCYNLNTLTLGGNFNTSNVTNMSYMFYDCIALTYLNLRSFDTSNVTNMSAMFVGCHELTYLNLRNFNTSNVTDMRSMFTECHALTALDLSSFNTSNVTDMSYMFALCKALTTLTLGENFNTSNIISMPNIFVGCNALNELTLYQTSSSIIEELPSGTWTVTDNALDNIGEVFISSGSSAEWNTEVSDIWTNAPLKLSDHMKTARNVEFTTKSIISGQSAVNAWEEGLWYYILNEYEDETYDVCVYANMANIENSINNGELVLGYDDMPYELLVDGDGKKWKVNRYTVGTGNNISGLFSRLNDYDSITTLTLRNWTNRNIMDMSCMFIGHSKLNKLELDNFNTSNVTDMRSMFANCYKLPSLDLSSFNTSKVTDMRSMFANCFALTTLNLNNFNTSNVKDMHYMFGSCTALITLDLSSFNTSNVTDMSKMFDSCYNITTLTLGENFNKNEAASVYDIFVNCHNITALTLYQTSFSFIKELPSGTWPVTNNASIYVGNVTIYRGSSATWNTEVSDPWTNVPWTIYIMKTARNVEFTPKSIISGQSDVKTWTNEGDLWYYILNEYEDDKYDICVYANMEKIKDEINDGTSLALDYDDMPYELLVDITGKTWKVNRYTVGSGDNISGLFGRRNDNEWNSNVVSKLISLTLRNWTNRNVTDMSYMFYGCFKLTSLDLSSFNTSTVTNMKEMFGACNGITSLGLSSFDTSNVTDMRSMFEACRNLTTLTLGTNFNTSLVKDMVGMFFNCVELTTLTLGENFNTSEAATKIQVMFFGCGKLTTVSLYQNASSIIEMLPSATWTVTNNASGKSGTVEVSQGSSATWSGDVPSPWTLTRTIQTQ